MKHILATALAIGVAGAALAQTDPTIPFGSPLDPQAAAQAQAQAAARLQAQQIARANALAAAQATRSTPAPAADDGRPRARYGAYGQSASDTAAPRGQPTPYFQFGQIRTPWDPR